VAEAKDALLESLKTLLPQVGDSTAQTQARYNKNYDQNILLHRVSVAIGDCIYRLNHTQKHKLDPKASGPYVVLETDGRTYLIDQDGLNYRVSGARVVPARPVDPAT